MGRPPGSNGSETRERILDAALELFTQQGYDKTSLRDIADRVQLTKAALYYYFRRKDAILLELHLRLESLGANALTELEAAPDGPARAAIWPRLANEAIDFMAANRELILLHTRNRGAFESLGAQTGREVELRFGRILASPDIPLTERVRMAATLGVITEVLAESADAFATVPPDELAQLVRDAVADLLPAAADQLRAGAR